jgi:hypothetical protein
MAILRQHGDDTVGEGVGFVRAAAKQCRRIDVVVAEVVDGITIVGIVVHGGLKRDLYLFGQLIPGDGAGAVGTQAVGAAQPVLNLAVSGSLGERAFASMDSVVDEVFRIEGTAK